jgi:hypothetical protein
MLYLQPPFPFINGVTLFRDHADPLQYYFLPVMPKLTRLEDPVTKQRIPQFQLIKYRGRAGNGGFLNFDVNLGLEPGQLEDIRSELRSLERLRDTPRLSPALLVDGTVKMMLFGKESVDPNADTTSADEETGQAITGPEFVLKINHHAKPALYGDNQAAFSVSLDQAGVTVLEQALQGEMSPIGVVYSLEFLALRPAYSVRLHIDWQRVQKHFEEHYGVNTWAFSADIDKAIDELRDDRVIVLEADTFVPEGEDSDGVIGRRDEALNQVRDMITDAFFEPSLDPYKAEQKDGWDKAADFLMRLAPGNMYSGDNALFTYKKVDYTRIDQKSLNVNISERTTVKRSIYPQGHLSGFFRILQQEGLDPNKFIIPVDLDDKYFERRKVKAIARAPFEDDAIASISVNMRYGNEPHNVVLEAAKPEGEVDWASNMQDGVMDRAVTTSYRVTFKNVDSSEQPTSLTSPEQVTEVENLEINPRELYSIVPVPILALDFPWARYPTLEIRTRYTDEPNGIRLAESFLLNEKRAEQSWRMFVRDPQRTSFQYKVIYRAANHKDIEQPWVDSNEERVIIRDPFPAKRALEIVPALNWLDVDRAFVDMAYIDKANNVREEQSFEFTQDDAASKTFSVALANPDLRQVAYEVTVLFRDGRLAEIPRSYTLDRRIFVRDTMKGHKIIAIKPAAASFALKRIKAMTVSLRFEDVANGLSYADDFTFGSSADRAYFEFDYVDAQRASYEYQVKYQLTNGLSRTVNWKPERADELVVPVG